MLLTGQGMSSVSRKWIMGLSGLFLCIFLIAHLAGNLILLSGDGSKEAFNYYADFMRINPFARIIRYITYAGILFHIIYAIGLSIRNRTDNTQKYVYQSPAIKKTERKARIMPVLGAFILVFLVVHLRSFWFKATFVGVHDLHGEVIMAFQNIYYVVFYVFAMLFLAYHLIHGMKSGIRTLGLINAENAYFFEASVIGFSVSVPVLYSAIPVFIYIYY